jgi:hypothetical protein
MPIIDISRAEIDLNTSWVALKVAAVMLFPSSERARESFLVSALFRGASAIAEGKDTSIIIAPSATALMPHVADPYRMAAEALTAVTIGSSKAPDAAHLSAGEIAGMILLSAIYADIRGERNITLRRSLEEVSDALRNGEAKSRSKNARPKDLKDHWHNFSSAAHLWAAYVHLGQAMQSDEGRNFGVWNGLVPNQPVLLDAFLATAESFRSRGERIKHLNAKEPLLKRAATWRLPTDLDHLGLPEPGS